MAYGIEFFKPNGAKVLDGFSKAGMFIKVITLLYNGGSSGSEVFTQVPSGFLYISINGPGSAYEVTVDSDGLGNARVNWTYSAGGQTGYGASTGPTHIIVFARKIANSNGYGAQIFNNSGEQLIDYNYPVPQYAGTVQPSSTPTLPSFTTEWDNHPTGVAYRRTEHKVMVNISPTTHRIITVNVPDSTTNDHWYSVSPSFIPAHATEYRDGANTTNIEVTLTILHPVDKPYIVPTLHIFSLGGPIVGGGAYALQCFNSVGTLVYDSSANNVTITDQKLLDYSHSNENFNSMPLEMPSVTGLAIPYRELRFYEYFDQPDVNGNEGRPGYWLGAVQRRGGTLHYAYHKYYYPARPASVWGQWSRTGTPSGTTIIAVDISQYSPATITGT